MAFSKIILNGVTQIDLTQDTVAAANLISPNTAHGADGQAITGTASGGGGVQSGSVTPASNSKTLTITLTNANISHLVIAESDFNAGEAGAGWMTMAAIWENGVVASLIRYNNDNTMNSNYANSSVVISGNTLTCTVNYNFRSSKTYNWYAW